MRNVAIHEYFFVDLEVVCTTVKSDLPKLKQQICCFAEAVTACTAGDACNQVRGSIPAR
jgi:uncharacterized protein with HEPN domain